MRKRSWVIVASVTGMLAACGGTKEPAESPAREESPQALAAPPSELEDESMITPEETASPESDVEKQELPCPGKKARYWDTGLVRSEVLTGDCEINGESFPAGTLLEFDEDGQLLTE